MTRHDDPTRLRHMLDHAREAIEMTAGRRREDPKRDRMLELALVRLVTVVGEAASRVSDEGQERLPSIPWTQVRGLRNRLVHGYDKVDLDILWDIIQDDLPPLIAELERVLSQM